MSRQTDFRRVDGPACAGDAGGRPTWGDCGRPPSLIAAAIVVALAGLVLAPYVTGGLLLLALVGAVLAADDYERGMQ